MTIRVSIGEFFRPARWRRIPSRANEDVGSIKEIMLDVPSRRVAYAVLWAGGFLGVGDRLFAIPWEALTLDEDRQCFIMDVDKQRLENAPGFDKSNWPDMADTSWRGRFTVLRQTMRQRLQAN
jgi:hypothetical protein